MYIVRDIFQLKFGHFKEVKILMEEGKVKNMFPEAGSIRVLSDFTGDSYRLILEEGYESLTEYEKSLSDSMSKADWKKWYEKFKQHVASSHREILKQIL